MLKRIFITIILVVSATMANAALRYVRADAGGNGSGADWTNAYRALPATLVRGDTYYVADGSYGSYLFNTPDGALTTIKKASTSDHGTDVGWDNSYGDGQARFGQLTFVTNNWLVDGAKRNENAWNDGASYGFAVTAVESNSFNYGTCPRSITLQYLNVGAEFSETYQGGYGRSFYLGGFNKICTDWTIRRNFVHNTFEMQLVGTLNTLIEYNWFGPTWGKEIIRGQVSTVNTTIRYNMFRNGCRDDHAPGSGCTAEVAFFGNQGDTPNFEGVYVYGNVVWKTNNQHKTDGTFGFQANDCKIFNNTIYDNAPSGIGTLACLSGAGSEIRNNITYYPGGLKSGCQAATCTSNSDFTSAPPFLSVASGNFRLASALLGTVLSTTYSKDWSGQTRGVDGTWDRGAFEFTSGNASAPAALAAPTGLRVN